MAKVPELSGIEPGMSLETGARAILRALYEDVLLPSPRVLRGDDTRAVHDMRVAIRRLRSAMATFHACFPKKRWRVLREQTRRLGKKLGEVRDADVHLAALRGSLGGAPLREKPGVASALDLLREQRRRALAEFAVELSQFDRESLARMLVR